MSSNSHNPSSSSQAKVLDLGAFRAKKKDSDDSNGRTPLYVSHLDGRIKGSPHFKRPSSEDFGDRIQRIRTSLEKINSLMSELKKQGRDKGKS